MKASESTRLKAESSLRGELDGRWQRLQEQAEERAQALQGQRQVGSPGLGVAATGAAGAQACLSPLSRKKAASWSSAGAWTKP